jgi:hypothetical protein
LQSASDALFQLLIDPALRSDRRLRILVIANPSGRGGSALSVDAMRSRLATLIDKKRNLRKINSAATSDGSTASADNDICSGAVFSFSNCAIPTEFSEMNAAAVSAANCAAIVDFVRQTK